MDKKELRDILDQVKNGQLDIDKATEQIDIFNIGNLGFAAIDNGREERVGYPEVIYGEGKSSEQIADITKYMTENNQNVLVTRANSEKFKAVKKVISHARYNELGRTITIINKEIKETETTIGIISAGTSDLFVVEEALETAKIFGNKVERIVDVGVAGIHRLFDKLETIKKCRVLIVIAGMEGALPSVMGGLVNIPIIAVPTSVGYGANLGGITALLAMLNSCASGISVVNIDNGFGAAYSASMINKL